MDQQARPSRMILVRHAQPVIVPEAPPDSWLLEADVLPEVKGLATAMAQYGADGVVASPEAKALGTAEIIAGCLQIPLTTDEAFREQGGGRVPFLDDESFLATVVDHFVRKSDIVFGLESSDQAARRFALGIERAHETLACPIVVTHGRVMCGYLAHALGVDPLPIWRSLRLPDAIAVELSAGTLERIEPLGAWRGNV